jgi:hypothetical protein
MVRIADFKDWDNKKAGPDDDPAKGGKRLGKSLIFERVIRTVTS